MNVPSWARPLLCLIEAARIYFLGKLDQATVKGGIKTKLLTRDKVLHANMGIPKLSESVTPIKKRHYKEM